MRASPARGKTRWDLGVRLLGLTLLCLAFDSQALTLGRLRGAALLGQALDVVVPVQLDASEEASAPCFEVDVFHADTRQAASRVRVELEARGQPRAAELRILSSAPVDEPVVTIYVRSGCSGQKTTRRYVLLTDLPVEVAGPTLPKVPASELDVTAVAPVAAVAPAPAPPAAPSAAAAASPAVRVKNARAVRPGGARTAAPRKPGPGARASAPSSARSSKPAPQPDIRPAPRARLKLDPLESFSDRIANLDAQAPVTQSEDALRNIQRLETLEGSVTTLRAAAAQNEARLAELKVRLQQAEAERFPAGLVYALLAGLLLCLLALAWLWKRERDARARAEPWWSDSVHGPVAEPVSTPARTEADARAAAPQRSGTAAVVTAAPAVDVDLSEASDSGFDLFLPAQAAEPAPAPAATPEPSAPALDPEESLPELHFDTALDIRQQAEFLVSLGQSDQAVLILKQQLDQGAAPNPFVCLDLLRLAHSLGLRADFDTARTLFQQNFNARVPPIERFDEQGRDLEAGYPDLLDRITARWPTPEALKIIDAGLLTLQAQPYDLAAFRELLLLHALAGARIAQGDTNYDVDLDLSHLSPEAPAAAPSVDLPLEDITPPPESGNLIEFELPSTPPPQR